ncbi:MAG: hypothetical protein IJ374_05195 [Lachnospiraceae bacterium]|nr:hypothetical protein [Lachnospiraceae bacterium]
MRHRKSEEIYLETIFLIEREKGYARRGDIAEENAFRIERAISHDLMDIIRNYVGEVTVCG